MYKYIYVFDLSAPGRASALTSSASLKSDRRTFVIHVQFIRLCNILHANHCSQGSIDRNDLNCNRMVTRSRRRGNAYGGIVAFVWVVVCLVELANCQLTVDDEVPMPSDAPSDNPSDTPSIVPSNSYIPSDAPSLEPSDFPSDLPSGMPTRSAPPSNAPSTKPSYLPSTPPTTLPSKNPTLIPSRAPSLPPSASPTLQCHDIQSYRSPLNGFVCQDHAFGDCTRWRYLGLKIEQLVELIQSCPVSCDIPCDELAPFETELTFGIHSVPNFLSPTTVATVETVTAEYITNFVQGHIEGSRFFLHQVELLSQSIVQRRNLRSTPSRRLQLDTDLVATVAFRGYRIGLQAAALKEYLLEGLASQGYMRSLQRSGDQSLIDIVISLGVDQTPAELPTGTAESERTSGVAVSGILASFLLLGAAGALVLQTLRRRGLKQLISQKDMAHVASPVSPSRSPITQIVSFESALRTAPSGRSNTTPTVLGISSSHSEDEQRSIEEDDLQSLNDAESEEEPEEEHPLTGTIPPMIVFEIVDEGIPQDRVKPRFRNVVPSWRTDASAGLLSQIKSGMYQIEQYNMDFAAVIQSINEEASHQSIHSEQCQGKIVVASPPLIQTPIRLSYGGEDELRKCIGDSGLPPSFPIRQNLPGRQRIAFVCDEASSSLDNPCPSPPKDENIVSAPADLDTIEESGRFLPSLFGTSPARMMRKTFVESSPEQTKAIGTPPRGRRKLHARSNSKESEGSADRCASYSEESGRNISFQVPRLGKLGLTIECDPDGGPVVRHVKDYSPLLGKIHPNDRVVSVDGVYQPSLSEVNNLLDGKSGSRWTKSSTMKIVLWRSSDEEEADVDDDCQQDFCQSLGMDIQNNKTLRTVSSTSRPPLARQGSGEDAHIVLQYSTSTSSSMDLLSDHEQRGI
jgi:hypothetical protein